MVIFCDGEEKKRKKEICTNQKQVVELDHTFFILKRKSKGPRIDP